MLIDWEQNLGWTPSHEQIQQFEQFYERLITANRSVNLTRIVSREEFWEKHLWDSISAIQPWLNTEQNSPWAAALPPFTTAQVIDIGTGGGFPGIPTAIACKNWQVSLLDATQKKINSLSHILEGLSCKNVTLVCDRAETLGHQIDHRAQYDLALIRAVAPPAVCAEYAMPLVRSQGVVILYRGHWDRAEEKSLTQALDELGGEINHVHPLQTPVSKSDRHCIYLKKTDQTPEKYPRRIGVPSKKPLGSSYSDQKS